MPYGVTPQGFVGKPLAVAEAQIDARLKAILGESAGTEPDGTIPLRSIAGQIKVLITDVVAEQWDLQQVVYSSFDPDQAEDEALDAVCAISGTTRQPSEFSTVLATCCGVPGTVLAKTRVATVQTTLTRFDSQADPATIAALVAWAQGTGYVVGDRRTANGKCYQCVQAGTSSGVGTGPAGTTFGADINDNTVKWRYVGTGTGAVDVSFVAEVAGPIGAAAFQLSTIATPVTGWTTVINLADAVPGLNRETNPALRARRQQEVAATGNATADAIRAALLAVNQNSTDPNHLPITSCRVFYNDTDFTDVNGVPPHSVEVMPRYSGLASPTTDQDIANAVWASVAAGIRTYGNQSSTVIDSEGNPQPVAWTKPTEVPIYVSATVDYDASKWPASSNTSVANQAVSATVNYGDTYPTGESVRVSALIFAIFGFASGLNPNGTPMIPAPTGVAVPGILDVPTITVGTAPGPVGASVAIGSRQFASFSSSRCVFTAAPVAP